jgi:hypothetical protein
MGYCRDFLPDSRVCKSFFSLVHSAEMPANFIVENKIKLNDVAKEITLGHHLDADADRVLADPARCWKQN